MKKIITKKFVAKVVESILVVGYIIFEELIWNVFAKPIYRYFKSLIVLDSLKIIFLQMNRYLLLTVFIVILAVTEAMGFFSGYCFFNGYIFSGIIVYALKIPIAAFTFWLFEVSKEKLMMFQWLKITYDYIMGLIQQFIHSDIHQYIKVKIIAIRSKIKAIVLLYFGEQGFIASVKAHYLVFKPFVASLIKR